MILYMYIVPLGRNFDVNRNILSLRSFVASFKNISLKSDFIHFFHDFIHVYWTYKDGKNISENITHNDLKID